MRKPRNDAIGVLAEVAGAGWGTTLRMSMLLLSRSAVLLAAISVVPLP
ncbi:hypothetical protein [Actinokineospora pegani]|nr:hypothetical protein [Actinokineospora pegani]